MTEQKKDEATKGGKASVPPHVESETERQERLRKEDAAGKGRSDPDGSAPN